MIAAQRGRTELGGQTSKGDSLAECFDVITCVGPRHLELAIKSIRSVATFASPRRIYVISSRSFRPSVGRLRSEGIDCLWVDEDSVCAGVDRARLESFLQDHGAPPGRAGWYLQQLAKISACHLEGIAAHYLIFDSDTVLLRPISFFDPVGRVLIATATEHHAPYFDLMQQVLGHRRLVNYSFITEHLMVRTAAMHELLDSLQQRFGGRPSWFYELLKLVEPAHLAKSGFSEFEFYGNFLASRAPGSFVPRRLKCWRRAASRYGHRPSGYALRVLAGDYDLASFESWQPASRKRPIYAARAVVQALWLSLFGGDQRSTRTASLSTYLHIARG